MSVRNRNGYANRRSSGGASYVKGAFVMLFLAMLSFALGFFVLARLMPDDHAAKAQDNAATVSKPANSARDAVVETIHAPATKPRKMAAAPVVTPAPKPDDGPMIEAQDETPTQKPADPDSVKPNATQPVPDNSRKRGGAPASPQDDPKPADPVQIPKQPDGPDPAVAPTDPTTGRKRFHVQINLHETREAAEQEAQQVIDRGISARVRRVIRGGRPLYRVEYSATYKVRANAEVTLQKLRDAGIDTAIVTEK